MAGSDDRALLIASDKGTQSAARRGAKCEVARMRNWDQFEEVIRWLRSGHWKDYSWINTDGLTMLWEISMVHVLAKGKEENPRLSEFIPSPAQHQEVHMMMKRRIEALCDLPVRTFFTALPMNVETQDGDEIVVPQIKGSKGDVSHYICGLMSAFGRMSVEENDEGEEVRRISWKPEGAYTGKDRYNGLFSPYTDDITLPQIAARIESPIETPRRTTRNASRRTGSTRRRRTTA